MKTKKYKNRKIFAMLFGHWVAWHTSHTLAGPQGGQVVAGTGQISTSGMTTTIQQSTPTLSLSWDKFNISAQETVNFLQPSASAVAVNRIFDVNGSQIIGRINANGQVFLINPNGVLFGKDAMVNVGSLVASTLDVSDANVNSSARVFSGSGTGRVVNLGTINAASGGYVAMLGNQVSNQGVITAQLGSVVMGAGSAVTLNFNGNSLVSIQVDQSVLNSLVENGGMISADGGRVALSAGARDSLLASVVNNTGHIEAHSMLNQNGVITLLGGMKAGTVNLAGTLDASAPLTGNGGFIETSAANVKVANEAVVDTRSKTGQVGTWLVDPQDYNVAAVGGDISGATLSTNLGTTSVTLQSIAGNASGSGNVNINDAVAWSANTTLTLTASNNVNVNSNIAATGNSAGLVINPNTSLGAEAANGSGAFKLGSGASITLSGAAPSLSISGAYYVVINRLGDEGSTTGTDLQGMEGSLNGHFALGSNIDASATSTWNANAGFNPAETLNAIEMHAATLMGEFSPMLSELLKQPDSKIRMSSLRHLCGLDMPDVIKSFHASCPQATFWAVYGQSEAGGIISMMPHALADGSTGYPLTHCQINIVDATGSKVPAGEAGEIVVSGPTVFVGYWGRPEVSATTLRDGWLHTGDIGKFDNHGRLIFVGRLPNKELIKSGGENVYPEEVELILRTHAAIVDVAVIGVPDKRWGESVRAVCVTRSNVETQELIDFVGERIANFKRPSSVIFVDSLPTKSDGTHDRDFIKATFGVR